MKTISQFILEAQKVHNDTYDYTKSNYINSHTPILIGCKKGHKDFYQRPYAHISLKQGCPECGLKNRKSNKKTTSEFILEAKEKWRDKYNYSQTIYDGKEKNIDYVCEEHGLISQKPYLHLKHGCPYCNGRGISKYTTEAFIKRAVEIHGNKYDYSKVNLNKITDEIIIICKLHGEFKQTAKNHINCKNGCPKCNGGVKINTEEYLKRAKEKHGEKFGYDNVNYKKSHEEIEIDCKRHGRFKQMAYMHLQSEHCCPLCVAELTSSKAEKEIFEFIRENYKGEIKTNDRITLGYKEIDIYLPELKLGIEHNGSYFHSELFLHKNYHLNKANLAESKGIKLIQVFEYEWNNKRDIVKSRLLSAIGVNKIIYARKTKIVELSREEKNNFLEKTHIQGRDNSTIYLGLKHEDEIVACMTFGKPRFNRDYDYELIRYSSEVNMNIVGGAGKLLKYFRNNYEGNIVSYADRRWSSGNMYEKIGFEIDGKTEAGYIYYNLKDKTILGRVSCQKYKLKKMPFYDENLSESDIMKLNDYVKIWNAGNIRLTLKDTNK